MKPSEWIYCECDRYARNIDDKTWIPTDSMQHSMTSEIVECCGCTFEIARKVLRACNWIKSNAIERIEAIQGNDDLLILN